MSEFDTLRMQCWEKAFHCFATGYIFECRARQLRGILRLLTFLGIVVPVLVGGIVTTYGTTFKYMAVVLVLAGILGLVQLVGSVWVLVAKWDDSYGYSQESTSANYDISSRYRTLGEAPPAKLDDFRTRKHFLDAEDQRRSEADYRQSIKEKEKRKGMRAALRNFGRACSACKVIPTSMKPSSCGVCGNF